MAQLEYIVRTKLTGVDAFATLAAAVSNAAIAAENINRAGATAAEALNEFGGAALNVSPAMVRLRQDIREVEAGLVIARERFAQTGEGAEDMLRLENASRQLGNQLKEMSGETDPGGFDKLKDKLGSLISQAALIGGAIKLAKDSINAFAEQEAAVSRLNAALRATGQFSEANSKALQDQASALQGQTAFADEAINNMQSLIVSFTGSAEAAQKLTPHILDLAAATGMDLDSAARAVSKAVQGQTDGLGRFGVVVDAAKAKTDPFTATVDALNSKFSGQARAQLDTYAGGMKALANQLGEVQEILGERFAGSLVVSLKALGLWKTDFSTTFKSVMASVDEFAQLFFATMGGVADLLAHPLDTARVIGQTQKIVADIKREFAATQLALSSETTDGIVADVAHGVKTGIETGAADAKWDDMRANLLESFAGLAKEQETFDAIKKKIIETYKDLPPLDFTANWAEFDAKQKEIEADRDAAQKKRDEDSATRKKDAEAEIDKIREEQDAAETKAMYDAALGAAGAFLGALQSGDAMAAARGAVGAVSSSLLGSLIEDQALKQFATGFLSALIAGAEDPELFATIFANVGEVVAAIIGEAVPQLIAAAPMLIPEIIGGVVEGVMRLLVNLFGDEMWEKLSRQWASSWRDELSRNFQIRDLWQKGDLKDAGKTIWKAIEEGFSGPGMAKPVRDAFTKGGEDAGKEIYAAMLKGANKIAAAMTPGGGGGGGGGTLGQITSYAEGAFSRLQSGTSFVERDQVAMLHRGERVVSAAENRAGMGGGGGNNVVVNITIAGGVTGFEDFIAKLQREGSARDQLTRALGIG